MITSIDTNVLVALWNPHDALNLAAQEALDNAFDRGRLVISGAVFAELAAFPRRTESFVDRFLIETGIMVDWIADEAIWRLAGSSFQAYSRRRQSRKMPGPRRILADFVIGAHAEVKGYRLLTLDEGIYRSAFPKLEIVTF